MQKSRHSKGKIGGKRAKAQLSRDLKGGQGSQGTSGWSVLSNLMQGPYLTKRTKLMKRRSIQEETILEGWLGEAYVRLLCEGLRSLARGVRNKIKK